MEEGREIGKIREQEDEDRSVRPWSTTKKRKRRPWGKRKDAETRYLSRSCARPELGIKGKGQEVYRRPQGLKRAPREEELQCARSIVQKARHAAYHVNVCSGGGDVSQFSPVK